MNTRLALILAQFLWMPGLLPAQPCRILSLDQSGLVTFQVSETNRYGGFQYASGVGESNIWNAVFGTHPGGGTWLAPNIGGNITAWPNVAGPQDGLFAQVGIANSEKSGFIVVDATGAGLTSITVYVAP